MTYAFYFISIKDNETSFFSPLVINNMPFPLQSTTSTFTQDTLAIGLCERHIPHRTPTVGGKKIRAPEAVL